MTIADAVEKSRSYLSSPAALQSIERDPYWPKWNSPCWKLSWLKAHGQLIPVLGILKFPDPNDSGWFGFKKAFLELVNKPIGILDLRGNSGGHLGMGAWMARSLGLKDLSPWEMTCRAQTGPVSVIRSGLRKDPIIALKRYTHEEIIQHLRSGTPLSVRGAAQATHKALDVHNILTCGRFLKEVFV